MITEILKHRQPLDLSSVNMTKKVVHVVQHLRPGGLECLVLDFLRYAPAHWDVRIISLEGEAEQAINDWPALQTFKNQITFLNKNGRGVSIKSIKQLVNYLLSQNIDVVHSHHIGPLLYAGISAKLASLISTRITSIHTEHDAWHLNASKNRALQTILLKLTKPIIVADAQAVQSTLSTLFPFTQPQTIYNGIDTRSFSLGDRHNARTTLGLSEFNKGDILIGSAGRLEPVKGHDLLIKAMHFMPTNYKLVIAGSGSQKETLQNLIDRLNLQERVTLLGRVDAMPAFYQSLDGFCLPSRHEGFPLSALEAQSCGIPSVVTEVGASVQTLCPTSGLSCAPFRPIALAKIIRRLEPLDKFCAIQTRQYIQHNFDVRSMVKHYQQLIKTGSSQ